MRGLFSAQDQDLGLSRFPPFMWREPCTGSHTQALFTPNVCRAITGCGGLGGARWCDPLCHCAPSTTTPSCHAPSICEHSIWEWNRCRGGWVDHLLRQRFPLSFAGVTVPIVDAAPQMLHLWMHGGSGVPDPSAHSDDVYKRSMLMHNLDKVNCLLAQLQ